MPTENPSRNSEAKQLESATIGAVFEREIKKRQQAAQDEQISAINASMDGAQGTGSEAAGVVTADASAMQDSASTEKSAGRKTIEPLKGKWNDPDGRAKGNEYGFLTPSDDAAASVASDQVQPSRKADSRFLHRQLQAAVENAEANSQVDKP